jgi:hypothetical protein
MHADQDWQRHRERDEIRPLAHTDGGNEQADEQHEQRHVDASEDGVMGESRPVRQREQRSRLQIARGAERRR